MFMSSEKLTVSATEQLKDAFKEIKQKIPDKLISLKLFTDFVIEKESVYDCRDGLRRIEKTYYGYIADYNLTELLKEYQSNIATHEAGKHRTTAV